MAFTARGLSQYVTLYGAVTAVALYRQNWAVLIVVSMLAASVVVEVVARRRIRDVKWAVFAPVLALAVLAAWY